MKEGTTNANQGAIVLIDHAADHGRLRSVLCDWGYTETEIHRFLNENEMSEQIQDSMNEQVYANPMRGQVRFAGHSPQLNNHHYRLVSGDSN